MKTTVQETAEWLPSRVNDRNINQGSYGHVGVICGSEGSHAIAQTNLVN